MEASSALVFIIFLFQFFFGIYFFNKQIKKESPSSAIITIFGFCGSTFLLLLLSLWLIDPGLEAILYLFYASGTLFFFWFAVLMALLSQYSKDKNKDKLLAGLLTSLLLILSIFLIWGFANAQGPMKFWG